jgi:hypothetical protein
VIFFPDLQTYQIIINQIQGSVQNWKHQKTLETPNPSSYSSMLSFFAQLSIYTRTLHTCSTTRNSPWLNSSICGSWCSIIAKIAHYVMSSIIFSKTNFSSVPKAYIKALGVGQLHSTRPFVNGCSCS